MLQKDDSWASDFHVLHGLNRRFPKFHGLVLRSFHISVLDSQECIGYLKKTVSLHTLQCFVLYLCDPRTIPCKKGTFICHFLHRNYQSYAQDSKLSVLETTSLG